MSSNYNRNNNNNDKIQCECKEEPGTWIAKAVITGAIGALTGIWLGS